MNTRRLIFENFRNIGVSDSFNNLSNTLLMGSIDGQHIGGLIILLGGNNDGKSNVLDGLASLADSKLKDSDKPDFMGYETKTPKLIFDYKIADKEEIEKIEKALQAKQETQDIESGIFSDKTFGMFFTDSSLKKGVEFNSTNTAKEYCLFIEKMLLDSEVYGIYGHDESSNRLEIRLILPKHNRMLLCSTDQGGKALKCFSSVVKNFNEIKDIERAIKLNCIFKVDSKTPKNCDDARLLREFLKQDFEKKTSPSPTKVNQNNNTSQNKPLHLQSILELTKNGDSHKTMLIKNQANIDSIESKSKGGIQNKQMQDLGQNIDVIKKCFEIPFYPKIVFYTEQALQDSDLESNGDNLKNSKFFTTLFKILEIDIKTLQNELKEGAANRRKARERDIEDKCGQINEKFNKLYCLSNDVYKFSVRLETNNIAFCMEKNGEAISLNQQSTGFKKFFNLFFNFLYDGAIKRGDIVLIDEAETHLGIPAQKELRKFLKDFGKKSGILFIIATHSPYMVDVRHLDEIRIVKALNSLESKNDKAKGSLFINDFSMLGYGQSDTLDELRIALGANIELDSNKIVFVEGIMDYNILNAYSDIYDSKDSKKLIFLPISGLGSKEVESSNKNSNEPHFSNEQKEKAENLLKFAKQINVGNPILLVDSDISGKAMKKGVEEDSSLKGLSVIELETAFIDEKGNRETNFKNIELTNIEFLLSKDDREKFGFESCKENKQASIVSSVFKNTENLKDKLSGESKNNFNKLFKYLINFKNEMI